MPIVTFRYERAKLYEEVWTEAVSRVAKRYNISDVGLRKICKKLSIPLPPLGHWSRVQAGHKIPVPPLPPHDGPDEIQSERDTRPKEPAEPEPPELVQRHQFEADPANRIMVPAELEHPHPLVAATQKAFRLAAREHARRHRDWNQYNPSVPRVYLHHDSRGIPFLSRKDALDLRVTETARMRVLRIFDALLRALQTRHLPVHLDPEGKKGTVVTVVGESISIRMTERTARQERMPTAEERKQSRIHGAIHIYPRYVFQPTNELSLGIVGEYRVELDRAITDTKTRRIEERLNEFVVSLFREAFDRKRRRVQREHERQAYEAAERRRHAREVRREKELERLKELEAEARQWQRAQDIRNYVSAAEASASEGGKTVDPASDLGQWIIWARQRADWLDPLILTRCPVLDGATNEDPDEPVD